MPRLSLTDSPVMTADVAAASSVRLLPYRDDFPGIALPDSGISCSLAGLTAGSYDLGAAIVASSPALIPIAWPTAGGGGGSTILTGTPIGGMTGHGGLSATFDGISVKDYSVSASSPGAYTGYATVGACGLQFSSPQVPTGFQAWSPTTGNGFLGNNGAGSWKLVASSSNDPNTATTLASGTFPAATAGVAQQISASFSNSTAYSYCWLMIAGNGTNGSYLALLNILAGSSAAPDPLRGWTWQSGLRKNAQPIIIGGDTFTAGQLIKAGSIQIDDTGGTASFLFQVGMDRKIGLVNDYHQRPVIIEIADPNQVHYTPAESTNGPGGYGFSYVRGNRLFRMRILQGVADQQIEITHEQAYFGDSSAGSAAYWCAIGVDGSQIPALAQKWGDSTFDFVAQMTEPGDKCDFVQDPYTGFKEFNPLEGGRGNITCFSGIRDQVAKAIVLA